MSLRLRLFWLLLGLATVGVAAAWLALRERAQPPMTTVALPSIGAELLTLDASGIVRRGSPRVLVLRFAQPVQFRPFHYRHDNLGEPSTIEAWADKLNAKVVFNAGQFDENLDYLGWLKRDDAWLSKKRKEPWKGLLVSGPKDGAVWARIVDLDAGEPAIVDRYRHVVQSMMLIDAQSRPRVRDSELTACRTVIAEDQHGRLLLLVTEGATTLGDLARWLPTTTLGIVRAMNLDGGIESQLAIRTPELSLTSYGQYGTGATPWPAASGQIKYPLPAVVGVFAADGS